MNEKNRNSILPFIFIALAGVALLSIGALILRENYLTRGIPDEIAIPVEYGGARLGFNVSLEQYEGASLNKALESIGNTGAKAVKQSFYNCDEFDWDVADHIVEAVGASGLQLVPLLDGCPQENFAPPSSPDSFAAWAGRFAERYGDELNHYIIWDEPNLTSHWGNRPVNAAEYAALLSGAAGAIRKSDRDAIIVAAPLAPTVETGPINLSDASYLQAIYESGAGDAFDVVAGKPYGFDSGPYDREVSPDRLNFSHVILLREVMEQNADEHKALWAGTWGWNSLPTGWDGSQSIWGQVDDQSRAEWTVSALERARQEWPWMGLMFLESWEPVASSDDPRWGFNVAGSLAEGALAENVPSAQITYPGFRLAQPNDPSQEYSGQWRFSPDYGADVGQSGDRASFQFWGTDIALNIRRADYHARFYVSVDGERANQLPFDGTGAALVLNSSSPGDEYYSTEPVAANLDPGVHRLEITGYRGSDQWALRGFNVGYHPSAIASNLLLFVLGTIAIVFILLAMVTGRQVNWGETSSRLSNWFDNIGQRRQMAIVTASALVLMMSGWLTWGEQAAGIYRRLGDSGQLALTAGFASIFYIAPSFIVYALAAVILFVLILLRPAWGLALVAFSLPFYVKPKPLLGFRFSPVEVFLLLTLAAFVVRTIAEKWLPTAKRITRAREFRRVNADVAVLFFTLVATASLLFTERLDVATNEWRVLIIEPAIFYFLLRAMRIRENEMWTVLDAFVLGGLTIALIGLGQYATGQNLITAEGGLMRLRAVYGSPNNVALYLGRIIPIVIAVALMGYGRRRKAYIIALIPMALAVLLTYSKGSLLLGLPAALVVVLILWRRSVGGKIWPWLVGLGLAGAIAAIIALQIPQISGRLNLQGETGLLRMSLWRSSLNMLRDHPIFGVGLDNFLYEYRGRYILDSALQEPDLSHPHNIFLDFATRLGLIGLAAGIWMIVAFFRVAIRLPTKIVDRWRPVSVGILGSLTYMVLHGLVDHGFFLVDLAYAFFLLLAIAIWLSHEQVEAPKNATIHGPEG